MSVYVEFQLNITKHTGETFVDSCPVEIQVLQLHLVCLLKISEYM